MSKYNRHSSVISRQSDAGIDEDHWLKQFRKSLEKAAVQPRSVDNSLFDQINSVMNGKSKHQSVESAVEDMKERSGLTAYIKNIKSENEETISGNTKTASNEQADDNDLTKKHSAEEGTEEETKKHSRKPDVIKKFPSIETTIENHIRDMKGNTSVPAIIDKIRTIHKSDVSDDKDWDDDKLIIFVSKLNLDAKSNNQDNFHNDSHLGERDHDVDVDASNTDAFHALMPAK